MKSLFDQTNIAGINLKNRFFRSATHEGLADEQGHPTQALFQVYRNLAEGGVGVIITGLTFVSKFDPAYPGEMGIDNDSFIEEYQKLTEMVHQSNAKIILQLVFGGPQVSSVPANMNEQVPWGPSSVQDLSSKVTPKEMTEKEILLTQKAFADAALRAKTAGFDGVQIHAAHGYLLSKFLTPYYNHRTDLYGGAVENRSRMVLESFRAIREKVGPTYPILAKLNCEDFMDQGISFDDCRYVCRQLSELGINALEISGGTHSSRRGEGTSRRIKTKNESYFKPYAEIIAQEVKVPVILVGGNRNFETLTEILNHSSIEYFAFSRPLICEPALINRWHNGSLEPAKCNSCNRCFRKGGTICVKTVKNNK